MWKSIRYHIFILIVLVLAECALVGYLGYWREFFWGAVAKKELADFTILLAKFSAAALGICFIGGYTTYFISYTAIVCRDYLTAIAIKTNYGKIEGGEQRVQEDCSKYPFLVIDIFLGIFKNLVIFITFAGILVYQVGILYLIIPIVYSLVGTFIASWLAKPLIVLNYMNQNLEAAFRRWVYKIRNYSESYRAPPDNFRMRSLTDKKYNETRMNNIQLYSTTKKLAYFQGFFNQITVIIPYVILASLYFSGKIVFGVLMQTASAMNQVIDCLSYVINSFDKINNLLSCKKRLQELGVINNAK